MPRKHVGRTRSISIRRLLRGNSFSSRPRARTTTRLEVSLLEERTMFSISPWLPAAAGDFCEHLLVSDDLHENDPLHVHALPAVDESLSHNGPTADATELAEGASGTTIIDPGLVALSETFSLHSNAGASHTIYLDFDGHVTSGTVWNSAYNGGQDIVTPAYDFDGSLSNFSDSELQRIQYIWQRVAEDFIAFDVNVTTEDPGVDALRKSGGGDGEWGVRVVIGGSSNSWYGSSAGGVAYVNSFNYSSDTPAFVFEAQLSNGNQKYTAEAISHEVGHTLGLSHDGGSGTSYYRGHGDGETGWAPIMGSGYYENLTQWSRGEYTGANNFQDDLAIITSNNGFGYRADDHGNSASLASPVFVSGSTVTGSGIIERNTDVDVFSFHTDGGIIDLTISPFARGPNLDILAELYDTASNLIFSSNPLNLLGATINTVVTAGQYFLHISGAGQGNPAGSGYSDYGSLGQYSISGNVTPSNDEFLSIAATDAEKMEGDSGTTAFTFTVTRSGNTGAATTVEYVVTGSGTDAADAADFADGVLPWGSVSFAAGEWTKTITVLVSGDTDVEANETFAVQLYNASGVSQITAAMATGTILADDVAATLGITVTPVSGLTTKENGTTASFSVVLDSQPTDVVVIDVVSTDLTEGTVSTNQLVFTAANWNVAQMVYVTGVDDSLRDGHVTYAIELTSNPANQGAYAGIDPVDVWVTNQDNEKGGKNGGGGGNDTGSGKGKSAGSLALVGDVANGSASVRISGFSLGQNSSPSTAIRLIQSHTPQQVDDLLALLEAASDSEGVQLAPSGRGHEGGEQHLDLGVDWTSFEMSFSHGAGEVIAVDEALLCWG